MVVQFYQNLTEIDQHFERIRIISEQMKLYEAINIYDESSVLNLAQEILNQNLKEIKKQSTSEDIDIDYRDATIISFALESHYENDDTMLTLHFCFTTSNSLNSSIGPIVSNQKLFTNLTNGLYLLKCAIKVFEVKYASLKITGDRELNKKLRKYKHPLGIFTYYDSSLEYNLPKFESEQISLEPYGNGQLLKVTSGIDLEQSKRTVLNFMEKFERADDKTLKKNRL
jgi:hypothetical protein